MDVGREFDLDFSPFLGVLVPVLMPGVSDDVTVSRM